MINGLIRFAVSQRLLVLLMVMILIGAGVYSLQRLPIDAVPDVTNVQVQILTAAPSLAPLEIERQITFPVEVAMSGLPGIGRCLNFNLQGLYATTRVIGSSCISFGAVCASIGTPAFSRALNRGLIYDGIACGFSIARISPVGGSPSLILRIGCILVVQPAPVKTSSKSFAYRWDSILSVIEIITILPFVPSNPCFIPARCPSVKRRSFWRSAIAVSRSAFSLSNLNPEANTTSPQSAATIARRPAPHRAITFTLVIASMESHHAGI
jgi:hypothetical protein